MALLSPSAASSSPSRSSGGSHMPSPAAPIVPHFDRYVGRPDLDATAGAAPVAPPGLGGGGAVHTAKKQRERTETARSVLAGMSWRFLTEGVMDDRDYNPPPVLTQQGMDYVARIERERAEAASRASNHSERASGQGGRGFDSPEPASLRRSAAGSGFQTPTGANGSSSLLSGMLSPPLHSAYYSPPVAPAPLQGKKSAFEAQMNSPVAHLFAGGAFSFATGANSKQNRAQQALEDAQWKPPPPAVGAAGAPRSKSPLKRFDADTPVVRRAREAARNAKSDYLARHHPVHADFNTPEMRNRLPPLAPTLTAEQLNITTETQTRVEGAPMLGLGVTREAAAAAAAAELDDDPYSSFGPQASAPKRMESTYTGLEQSIIDMTAASIRESKAQPLPRPTPQPKRRPKKSNDITAQFEKKQAALARKREKDAAYAQAQMQAQQQALAQQQQQQQQGGLKIITDESHSHAVNTLTLTHEDGSPIVAPVEEKELISLPLLPRMPTPRNQYSSESEDSTAYTSSSSSSSDAEADDFAEERAERVAQARAFHASLRNHDEPSEASTAPGSSMGARGKGGVGDQRPGDTPSASSLIVWKENHRVQAARDIPASVAAQLLAEPTAEDRMEQLQRIHRAEDEAEAMMAAAAQAEAELEAEMQAMNDAANASADAAAAAAPAETPQHIRFAQARDGLREFQPPAPQPLPASPFPMLVPGTPVLRPDPLPLIAASEYADPRSRFEQEHTPLLAKAAAIIDKEVRFDYLSQQAAKIAAAAAAKKAKADAGRIEEMLDSGGSRAAIHAMLGGSRSVAAVVRPDFKFQLYPERANRVEQREQLFAGLSAEHGNNGVLSPQQQRRKEALARREAARLAREAASPSPSNPQPAFRPPHARPHAFDPLAGSSFVPATHITSPKKKLGAWYQPVKQWKTVPVARDNEDQREREEAEEAVAERVEYEASLPRSMQEKSAWLRESIPTLFIASVYKGHLEAISKAQQAAAAREAKELAAQERNAGYQFHKGKLPGAGAGTGAGAGSRPRGISQTVLVTPPPAAPGTAATTVAGSLSSTTTSLGPVVRGSSATSTTSSPPAAGAGSSAAASAAVPDPLAHTPVRMPSYLDALIPLDSSDDRIVIVDFAPNTNKVAALAPILAEAAKSATGGAGGKGKGWSKHGKASNSASKAAEKALVAEESAALLTNPNIAILQARAVAAAEAQAVRTATIGITPNSAARLTAMTASQQSKQREKIAPTSPSAGEAAPRSTPHFIPRTPPPPPDTTYKKAHQSSHSISDMIVAHQSSSVAASLRESVQLSPEEAEEQAIMAQALERRRRNAATPQPRMSSSSRASRNSSRPGSASPSPRPSPRSGSAGEVRFAPSTSPTSAGSSSRLASYAKQPHVRHQSLTGSNGFAQRSSKSDRQSVSSRDSYDVALAGLTTQSHHSHVFLPNVSAASAMASNKERAAANVSMLTRLHEQAAELEKERAAAAAAAAAGLSGPSASPRASPRQTPKHGKQQSLGTVLTIATTHPAVAAALAASPTASASGSPTLSASSSLGALGPAAVGSSSILDHREFAPDDQEYQHPLEVGMRREPRLMHFQIHQQQQRASMVATQQAPGEGLLSGAQLKTIAMRRLAEGDDEDDEESDEAQQHRRQQSNESQESDAAAVESDRRRRSMDSNQHFRPVRIAPVSISIDELDSHSWGTPLSPTHLSATTPLMSPASRTQLPQKD